MKRGKRKNLRSRVAKKFKRLDSNGDGVVSRREFVSAKSGKHMRRNWRRRALPPTPAKVRPVPATSPRYSYKANMRAFAKLSLF